MTSPLVSRKADIDFLDPSSLETGSFVVTGTGFTTTVEGVAQYAKFGQLVVLFIPELTGTSNDAAFTITGMPPSIMPTQTSWHACRATNNSSTSNNGYLRLNANSLVLDMFRNADPTLGFATSNTKAVHPLTVAYVQR